MKQEKRIPIICTAIIMFNLMCMAVAHTSMVLTAGQQHGSMEFSLRAFVMILIAGIVLLMIKRFDEEREADRYEKYRSFVILFVANAVGASIRSILYLFTDLQLNDRMLQNLSYLILSFCLIILVVIKKRKLLDLTGVIAAIAVGLI